MIRVENLQKTFHLYRKPSDRLKEILTGRTYHTVHSALRDVTFTVADGETVGIVGRNGAGKSTLLKLLTGILLPDNGIVETSGKITGLLELGTGFNHELSGWANIRSNGLMLGMSGEEIQEKRQAIAEFSELGKFLDQALKTYSSGMLMRLAFSVAIHADPRCFVVDEALSVGDAHFQQKCMKRIREFRAGGGSIIFVSHDMNSVKVLCDRAILLEQGRVVEDGDPERVVNAYNFQLARTAIQVERPELSKGAETSYGSRELEILSVTVAGEGSKAEVVSSGETTNISVSFRANRSVEDFTVGIMIRDRFGQDIFGINTYLLDQPLSIEEGEYRQVDFTMPMDISPGKYTITAALHTRESHVDQCFHWHDRITTFEVAGIRGPVFAGMCRLQPDLHVH
ncbi:ABC transporter ATP-binding protein [Skermanella mucosa]|uniref:ABC transporter ATP-binding protein n=1 Tax=Skermanella mucosa TaxID=1789672 RepID=UPI00192C9D89|nr:ABC transporter ATP-binding protein [Skermanella mucosa]UEM20682.1 ABC transporter ATP-binding protein [Skermanella mucosa]